MADAKQSRLDSESPFRLASAGCGKFFDELNNLGWDVQLQMQEVERDAQKLKELKERRSNSTFERKKQLEKEAIYESLNHRSSACTGRGRRLCPTTTDLRHPGPWLHRPNAGPVADLRNPDPRRRIHVSNAGAATDLCDSEHRWTVHPAAIRPAANVHAPEINRASVLKVGVVSLIGVYSAAGKDGLGRASKANSRIFWKAGEGPEPRHN
jgi:hypothetical protein